MNQVLETYEDFLGYLDRTGFIPLSGNPLGYPSLSALILPGQWHTGLDTDPWQWKTRVVEQRRAAYAKLFFGQPSFVTESWYPAFLSARRGGRTFEEAWESGTMSAESRRIYRLFDNRATLAAHEIKRLGGFDKPSAGKYENAMKALQTGMFITVSGMTRMTATNGRPHSWPVTEYRRVEDWAWPGAMEQAARLDSREAVRLIADHMRVILPEATEDSLHRLIGALAGLTRA